MSKLLIVESPTKARTIEKMLGPDYEIIASMGHVRDLPEHELGIDLNHDFTPTYVDTAKSQQTIKKLRSAAKNADTIFLATDPDREGEAIAWHLRNLLNSPKKTFYRVSFHEITRQAIQNALANRGEIDQNLVDAQQARRVLDRIVGYKVSPLLWRRLGKGSSAGRVQSVALRLIVEREREINDFHPVEYWTMTVLFVTENRNYFKARLFKINAKDFLIGSETDSLQAEAAIRNGSRPLISNVSSAEKKRNPYPPFTTSTLQQSANISLHLSASATMRCAQQLYEGITLGDGNSVGLITYMRTDSVTIAQEAQATAAAFIRETYGSDFVPPKFNYYKNKAAAQEAHEAIRPTDVRRTPEMMAPFLDPMQLKLYTLIWRRFVASQMSPAKMRVNTVDVTIQGNDRREYLFRAGNSTVLFPGFLILSEEEKSNPEQKTVLPADLQNGMPLTIRDFEREQKFTEPPPRFSEAALIKTLEENGIGRPSTYATILKTIQDREYVRREHGKLLPTELGFTVNDFLVNKLPALFEVKFTAQMEQKLDDVEAGEINWVEMMRKFYDEFSPWVEKAALGDAPQQNQAKDIFELLSGITYDAPQKIGRRTYDDASFVNSIAEKYQATGKMSDKQYQALLKVAAKYVEQLPPGNNFADPQMLVQIKQLAGAKAAEEENQEAARNAVNYQPVFDAMSHIVFPTPDKENKRRFDEGKFFRSLNEQYASGKALSEKQVQVLKRFCVKYLDQIPDSGRIAEIMGISPEESATEKQNGDNRQKAKQLLAQLGRVKEWAPAEKLGRFMKDDRKFYGSLAKQFADGKKLSDKQLAALEKLAEKYSGVVAAE